MFIHGNHFWLHSRFHALVSHFMKRLLQFIPLWLSSLYSSLLAAFFNFMQPKLFFKPTSQVSHACLENLKWLLVAQSLILN